uniref:Uncharacterized protein n=1 Tax=Chlamydomonas euryale TaxID=1486919 RepID=A0A7R9YTW9_9CHLO
MRPAARLQVLGSLSADAQQHASMRPAANRQVLGSPSAGIAQHASMCPAARAQAGKAATPVRQGRLSGCFLFLLVFGPLPHTGLDNVACATPLPWQQPPPLAPTRLSSQQRLSQRGQRATVSPPAPSLSPTLYCLALRA